MKISVLFATYNRDDILTTSLNGYLDLSLSNIELDIVVVDNACLASTKKIVESLGQLPIHYLQCPTPGKNAALNMGLKQVKGDYIVLTDDDTIPDKNWLRNYALAFKQYSELRIFGGRIIPNLNPMPTWVNTDDINIQGAFGLRDLAKTDLSIRATDVWGANMAISADIFKQGFNFNENIGPNGKNYVMGSETEFLNRLHEDGYQAMYVANASVAHQIRPEQLSIKWLKGRAFRQGQGIAHQNKVANVYNNNVAQLFGVPRFMVIAYLKGWFKLVCTRWLIPKKLYVSKLFATELKRGELVYLKQNTD